MVVTSVVVSTIAIYASKNMFLPGADPSAGSTVALRFPSESLLRRLETQPKQPQQKRAHNWDASGIK
jgi:hypothetical protein